MRHLWEEERLRNKARRYAAELASLLTLMPQSDQLRRIRFWLAVFMAGLILSGVTAFPLKTETNWLASFLHTRWLLPIAKSTGLLSWIAHVNDGINAMDAQYPFLAYGTDWLAFAHLVLAVAFVGPYLDPVRNKWVITFGLIACAGVIPLALIAGPIRGIPFGWRLVDCSFGAFGCIPLLLCRRLLIELERTKGGVERGADSGVLSGFSGEGKLY